MFDIGFSELVLIAVVALVVLGPERLPRAARFAGLWVRRARAQWYSVKAEFEREVAAEEFKRSVTAVKTEINTAVREVDAQGRALTARVRDEIGHLSAAATAGVPPGGDVTGGSGGDAHGNPPDADAASPPAVQDTPR